MADCQGFQIASWPLSAKQRLSAGPGVQPLKWELERSHTAGRKDYQKGGSMALL